MYNNNMTQGAPDSNVGILMQKPSNCLLGYYYYPLKNIIILQAIKQTEISLGDRSYRVENTFTLWCFNPTQCVTNGMFVQLCVILGLLLS